MNPHNVYGSYQNPFHESFLDQQPFYLPQPNSVGATIIVAGDDAATQSAGLPPVQLANFWEGVYGNMTVDVQNTGLAYQDEYNFYQTINGGSSAALTPQDQVFLPSDGTETLSQTSFFFPLTGPIAYPSTSIAGFLDPISSQATQLSYSTFILNGVQHCRCACGHETRRKGDMLRHHESSKHSLRKHFCSLCEKWFTRPDGLRRHVKTKHRT
ncbi:hypothetical protein APHAL10511_008667 [Amanita phalloides]|nr:hypothetical protein APHAL10511_008667 [Amanita phalloides]